MTRCRTWLSASVALLLTALVSPATAQSRANVMFILVDDMGWGDLGVFYQNSRNFAVNRNNPAFSTPGLDAMAAQGVQLRRHYCAAPVCAPSRASLLLGVHQGHANVRDNSFDKALENNHTLGTVMRQAGYATALIGKFGLQGSGLPAPARPELRGFDSFFGYLEHGDAHFHYPKETGANVYDGTSEVTAGLDKCYSTDLITARTKKWLTDHRAAHPQQPFFAMVTFTAPHARLDVPTMAYPAGRGLAGGLQWTGTPGSMINTAAGTINSWLHPDYAAATYDHDSSAATPETAWPDHAKRHATMLRRVDDAVSDLLATLADLGVANDTLVVFTSDNGTHNEAGSGGSYTYNPTFFDSFGPLEGIKRDCWEGGLRVPALALWPGRIPAGRITDAPGQFHDWLPTLAEVAGIPPPARTDGVSLMPMMTGAGTQRAGIVYSEYFFSGNTPSYTEFDTARRGATRSQEQAIFQGGYKGIRYNVTSAADDFRIYDTLADPAERANLVGSGALFTALQQSMKDRVLQVRRPGGGVTRTYDSAPVPAVNAGTVTPGLQFAAFEGSFPWVPDFAVLTPVATGLTSGINLSVRTRADDSGVQFSGFLDVAAAGTYTFYLTTDSRAFLRLHDAAVIDADFGYSSGTEVSASVNLAAGRHPLRLSYARGSGSTASPLLLLQWAGPGILKQPVPESRLLRAGAPVPAPPVAVADSAGTDAGTAVIIPVLANDADDGAPMPLAITRTGQPANGATSIIADTIRYTPRPQFYGEDLFSYTISDGADAAAADVRVRVHPALGAFLWLPLDEVDGASALEAGGRAVGTLINFSSTVRIPGRHGRALSFDGTDDQITIAGYTPPAGSAPRTVAAWLRPAAAQTEFGSWLSYGANTNGARFTLRVEGGRLRCEVQAGYAIGTRLLTDGAWHHAVVVVSDANGNGTTDVNEVKFYVDGTADAVSSTSARALNTVAGPALTIGGSSHAAGYEYKGDIDDLRIYAAALTSGQISGLAAANAGPDAWFYRHSGNAGADAALWLADGDGDSVPALLEYYLGGNPTCHDEGLLPMTDGAESFSYNRRTGLPADAGVAEVSADLIHWEPLTNLTVTAGPPGSDLERVTAAVPQPAGTRLFFRLRVTL